MDNWRPIRTAPKNGLVLVSMRDVDREPPVWFARRATIPSPTKHHSRPERIIWIDEADGLACAPTHWAPRSSTNGGE